MAIVFGEQPAVVVEAEEAGEAAEAVEDAGRMGPPQERRHAGQRLLVQFEVEAGGPIGQGRLLHDIGSRGAGDRDKIGT